MNNLLDCIWKTKMKNCLMFAHPQQITENMIRWVDEKNPLHYNRNHFLALKELSDMDIQAAINYQLKSDLQGFLLKTRSKLTDELIAGFGLKEEKQLVMAQLTDNSRGWDINPSVQIKDSREEDVSADLMTVCLSLAKNDLQQRWIHQTVEEVLEVSQSNPCYHWLVAYKNDLVVGRCYVFEECGCVQMEDLWVAPQARHCRIGTTLMKYVRENFEGLFFLHTEAEDSVKTMYSKLGFSVVDEVYEYSKIWRNPYE